MQTSSRYDAASSGDRYRHVVENISVTPATPPPCTQEHDIPDSDVVGVRTPTSECGSSGGSGYSPSLSDISYHSQPEHTYMSEPLTYQPLPFSPSSSALRMFSHLSIDATLLTPEVSPHRSRYTEYPSTDPGLSPVLPLLNFAECGDRDSSFEDNSDASSTHSPFESGPPLLLFDPAQLPPRLVFHSEADHPTVSAHSRTYSAGSNDRLAAPPFRRHSFNTQRSGATFFFSPESGLSTPDTPSSPFPSSDYSVEGTASELLFRHPPVAQQSGTTFIPSAEGGQYAPNMPSSPFPPSPYSSVGTSPELPLNPQVASPSWCPCCEPSEDKRGQISVQVLPGHVHHQT
ncbi:hypothetical protein MVEN_02135300 [Mycena venus]|uniref:Uncharacterized protein n=1 Tax=Mycena venus TaxID=2733690 RepID=A0A8H7CIU4_9AGAR|nr:hypothetical protein MVEN_02135300 [Mycena venus]